MVVYSEDILDRLRATTPHRRRRWRCRFVSSNCNFFNHHERRIRLLHSSDHCSVHQYDSEQSQFVFFAALFCFSVIIAY